MNVPINPPRGFIIDSNDIYDDALSSFQPNLVLNVSISGLITIMENPTYIIKSNLRL